MQNEEDWKMRNKGAKMANRSEENTKRVRKACGESHSESMRMALCMREGLKSVGE
jgi:hypothetical protein